MSNSNLFKSLTVGRCQLQHRVVMAPLTRYRASAAHLPQPLMVDYYSQRASTPGTLLITEATFISPRGGGYPNIPGIWTKEQIIAWKDVTAAVHAKGSFIFLQLWFLGRAASPKILARQGGYDVVSSSATPETENSATPRALTVGEIETIVEEYAQAARNAIEAGFDGVEIHGANGYLIDQFTQSTCNKRTDKYGGSIKKRSRFGLEVARAVVDAVGPDRVGMRISPFSTFQGMKMEEPIPQFQHLIEGLKPLKLAYLHVVESRIAGSADVEAHESIDFAISAWGDTSPVLVAGGFKPSSAIQTADIDYKDKDIAIVFGRYFISNPDLPFRIQNGVALNSYDRSTFYTKGSKDGYTSYPFSDEWTTNVNTGKTNIESRI